MPLYLCKVADSTGRTKKITKEAPNADVLAVELIQQSYSPIKISEIQLSEGSSGSRKRYAKSVILEFTDTINLLLSSGLSLKDALEVSKTIFKKGPVNALTNTLVEKIKKGDSFYQALEHYKNSFPPLYRGLVKIGEKIGSLENIFARLTEYLRESRQIRNKLANALIPPATTLGFALLGVVGMAVFIFPRITSIFTQMQNQAGNQIQSTMVFVNIFFTIGALLLGIIASLTISILIIRRTENPLRKYLDNIVLKLPIIGKVIRTQESLNFLFAMETLTSSGFAVEDALPEAAKVFNNRVLSSGLGKIREKIIKGAHLSQAFLEDPNFEERIGRWMAIGERSGKVDKVFVQLRSYYQDELEKWSTRFMGIVEPLVTILVGMVILFIILTFFVPIFSIYRSFGT